MGHMAELRGYTCPVPTMGLRADKLEAQWGEIVARIQLPSDWRQRIENLAGDPDERNSILREREAVQEKLRRIKQLYKDLMMDEVEYRAEHEALQSRLSGLVLPNSPHVIKAGEYLENLGALWNAATLVEQREITRVLLKSMYIDVEVYRIVSIEPQAVFRLLFAEICEDLGVEII